MRVSLSPIATSRSAKRYLAVGVVNTIVGLALIYTAMYAFGLRTAQANVVGYVGGFLLSFALNRRWTFGHSGRSVTAFARFIVVTCIAYLVNLATVLLLTNELGMNRYLAQAAGIPPYTIVGYIGARFWAFKTTRGE